jgi:hypothetical protein
MLNYYNKFDLQPDLMAHMQYRNKINLNKMYSQLLMSLMDIDLFEYNLMLDPIFNILLKI